MNNRNCQDSGPFGRGGEHPVAVMMAFYGMLGPAFVEFAIARANRLSLTGWIREEGNRVLTHIEGPEALIGAFEMACCLGPLEADVQDWDSTEVVADPNLSGFDIRHSVSGKV